MTNKILKHILLGSFLSVTISSCDLEVTPTSSISTETFWKTEKDAWYNLNTIYSATIPGSVVHNESYTDDFYCQYSWESNGAIFQQNGFSPLYDEGWDFSTIRKQNIFLQEVENVPMDENLRNRFKAEVRAMRAWSYLNLTKKFGNVPLITEVLPYDASNVKRDEASIVREFILNELTEVADMLPEKYSGGYPNEKGRITKWAALAIKARAALYFGDYAAAEKAAKEIIDSGTFSLFKINQLSESQQKEADEMELFVDFEKYGIDKDKYMKGMFSYESLWHTENGTPDNPEFIMTRQYMETSGHRDWVRYTAIRPNQMGGWSSVTPTQNLVDAYWTVDGKEPTIPTVEARAKAYKTIKTDLDSYKANHVNATFTQFALDLISSGKLKDYDYIKEFRNRDSRLYASILFPFKGWYETNYGDQFVYEWIKNGNNESKTGFNFRKMCVLENDMDNSGEASGDYPCIRYAEILLIFAEAHTQVSGFDVQVQSALNQLRDRCGMPNVSTGLSKESGLDLIKNERRIELAGEGFRYDDLSRYSDEYWDEHMENVDITMPDGERIITMRWNERMHLFPIPQTARDLNPLLDQNPGY